MTDNASLELARQLFPNEEFVVKEAGVWCAKSRLQSSARERTKLAWEVEQIRVLLEQGAGVVFLPEHLEKETLGVLSTDAIINGEITEIKSVSGTRATLGTEFKKGYRQGAYMLKLYPNIKSHSVYIRLLSDLTIDSVRAKVTGELKNRTVTGRFICYFENTTKLYTWTYDELRAIIQK